MRDVGLVFILEEKVAPMQLQYLRDLVAIQSAVNPGGHPELSEFRTFHHRQLQNATRKTRTKGHRKFDKDQILSK